MLDIDEEHQRGEEELAEQVDHLPEEEAWFVVAPEKAARPSYVPDSLRHHLGADPEQQREECERDEHRPEYEESPEVGVEAAVLDVGGATEHLEVGHEVAAYLPAKDVYVVRLALLRLEDGARDGRQQQVGDNNRQVKQAALRVADKSAPEVFGAIRQEPLCERVASEGGASEHDSCYRPKGGDQDPISHRADASIRVGEAEEVKGDRVDEVGPAREVLVEVDAVDGPERRGNLVEADEDLELGLESNLRLGAREPKHRAIAAALGAGERGV
mmetsp:Transcript_32721/g.96728  ORF Transcript_32721/g.96728 Transcript_32721/m.96728 type:complete len:272 (+) Transcript_32721:3720-4535(+)